MSLRLLSFDLEKIIQVEMFKICTNLSDNNKD